MSATNAQESESDDLSSSGGSESDDENDDTSDTCSYRSLAFSTKANRRKAVVKSKKSKKKVRFKPGDSLVLIYIIPNREMLGLKSGSEDSDESGEESDEEEDDDDDDDEDDNDNDDDDDEDDEEDDEEEDDDDEDEDDDSGDDEGDGKKKNSTKKPKPFAKLLAVKQINRRKPPDLRNNVKRAQEKTKVVNIDLVSTVLTSKKKARSKHKKDRKEKVKLTKKESKASNETKGKTKSKRNKTSAIKVDGERHLKSRRNRSRLLEIRATVEESANKKSGHISVPKVMYKNDIKPALIDVNSNSPIVISKPLTTRARLQPTSVRITKESDPLLSKVINSTAENPVSQVVTASYDSLTSVMPTSYINLSALKNNVIEETVERLDPDNMNKSGKRNYAWQIANGTISSQSLRTPSILPFWDSLQNSVS